MTQHDEPALPEDRFTYEVGAHEKTADDWEAPPVGASIRLMGDHGADMPLWTEELLLADAGEGVRLLGLSQGLASDLETGEGAGTGEATTPGEMQKPRSCWRGSVPSSVTGTSSATTARPRVDVAEAEGRRSIAGRAILP